MKRGNYFLIFTALVLMISLGFHWPPHEFQESSAWPSVPKLTKPKPKPKRGSGPSGMSKEEAKKKATEITEGYRKQCETYPEEIATICTKQFDADFIEDLQEACFRKRHGGGCGDVIKGTTYSQERLFSNFDLFVEFSKACGGSRMDTEACNALMNGKFLSKLKDGRNLSRSDLERKMSKLSTCRNDEGKAACKAVADPVKKACYTGGREVWFAFYKPREKQKDIDRLIAAKKQLASACEALPAFLTEWGECLGKFQSCNARSAQEKCAECGGSFQKTFQNAVDDVFEKLTKERAKLDEQMNAKEFQNAHVTIQHLQTTTDTVLSMAAEGGFEVEKESFEKLLKSAEEFMPTIKKELLKTLEAKRCPKGKSRNKGREAKFKKIIQAFMSNDWPHDQAKVRNVRMDGPIVRTTVVFTKRESYPVIVCYEKGSVSEAPRCRVHEMTMAREKPRGGRWTKWRVDGLRSGGDLLCKNINR
jgi:hypothetical protein